MKIRLSALKAGRRFSGKPAYEAALEKHQIAMLSLQQAYFHQKRRGIIVFEGLDAAGKGGAIRRITEKLDPRGVHVWPIGAPAPAEQGRHYLHRFWERLPERGALAIFDRSWYGRVLVERVDGLCAKADWMRAYREIVEFERMLVADGVAIVKIFLHVSPKVQLERFAERLGNPTKRWKLTQADVDAYLKGDDYRRAIDDMFAKTSWSGARWHAIHADSKWRARVDSLKMVLDALGRGVDVRPPAIDHKLRKAALAIIHRLD
ncbi:MAG: polyphosphate kinase [Alphaproteobacteria bacterium]|nr:polyphosphate kinase [Alphaproteobacteria bacterium]